MEAVTDDELTAVANDLERYCTFWVGEQHYGIEIGSVREVLKRQRTTPVPTASTVIGGLINLRGEIVTAIDLRTRLELPPLEDHASMSVVVSLDGEVVSLVVDSVGDVVDLSRSTMQPTPATVLPQIGELMIGVYRQPDGLIQILDAKRLIPADIEE